MKPKNQKINTLSKKIASKIGLSFYDVDAILKITAYEIIEILKKEQKIYWDGLGIFFLHVNDKGLSVRIKLSEDPYNRLNEKTGERTDEIIFE